MNSTDLFIDVPEVPYLVLNYKGLPYISGPVYQSYDKFIQSGLIRYGENPTDIAWIFECIKNHVNISYVCVSIFGDKLYVTDSWKEIWKNKKLPTIKDYQIWASWGECLNFTKTEFCTQLNLKGFNL